MNTFHSFIGFGHDRPEKCLRSKQIVRDFKIRYTQFRAQK